jgi:hypothetical protein
MISLEFIGNKQLNLILIIKEFLKQNHYWDSETFIKFKYNKKEF